MLSVGCQARRLSNRLSASCQNQPLFRILVSVATGVRVRTTVVRTRSNSATSSNVLRFTDVKVDVDRSIGIIWSFDRVFTFLVDRSRTMGCLCLKGMEFVFLLLIFCLFFFFRSGIVGIWLSFFSLTVASYVASVTWIHIRGRMCAGLQCVSSISPGTHHELKLLFIIFVSKQPLGCYTSLLITGKAGSYLVRKS